MPLFYKVSGELKTLEAMISAVGGEMAALAGGRGRSDVLEDMLPDTLALMRSESERLRSEGGGTEVGSFRKHMRSVGKYMANAPYNVFYAPLLRDNLKD